MNCDYCEIEYDKSDVKCAYCIDNPHKQTQQNFTPKFINLTTEDFDIESLYLNPNDDSWYWIIEQNDVYKNYVFDLVISIGGVKLKRMVTIKKGRCLQEKMEYISKMFDLPLNRSIGYDG